MKGRKTGGRKRGTPNRSTSVRRQMVEAGVAMCLSEGVSPLEVILKTMRGGPEAESISDRMYAAALAAAPYVHARLTATHVTGSVSGILGSHEERLERLRQLEADPLQIEGVAEPVQDEGDLSEIEEPTEWLNDDAKTG